MNNREKAQHHYFSDNGLYAQKKGMDETIDQYVNAHIIPSGWVIAYGGLNYFYTDKISQIAMKRRVNSINLQVILEGLQGHIDKGYTSLGEFILSDEVWIKGAKT